jgi:hypothetical protein
MGFQNGIRKTGMGLGKRDSARTIGFGKRDSKNSRSPSSVNTLPDLHMGTGAAASTQYSIFFMFTQVLDN